MNAHADITNRLPLSSIRTDGGTQSRAQLYHAVVSDYIDTLGDGAEFPPVVVFFDGSEYWLADGFHRHAAYAGLARKEIPVDIHQGTRRDAILHSVGANSVHGLRRTNEDKRRAVMVLLNDPEWGQWSNREISRQCRVSPGTVDKARLSLPKIGSDEPRTYTNKHGTQSQMKTENIGGNRPAPTRPPASNREPIIDPQPKPTQPKVMNPKALWLWGRLKDFERDNILSQSPDHLLSEMTEPMRADVRRLLPLVREFIEDLETLA